MKRTKLLVVGAAAGVLGIGAIAGFDFPLLRGGGDAEALFASGTVEATDAQVGFEVPGRIERVLVREGDRVEAGAPVAALGAADAEARRAQAEAAQHAALALLREMERGARPEEIAQAQAALAAAERRREDAERDLARTRTLFEGGAVSQEAYDKTQTALALVRSQEQQVTEQLRLLRAGPRAERIEAQRALVAQAAAALRSADEMLARAEIRAPFAATVAVQHREPGEVVPPGAPVLTLVDLDSRWVRIYIPEDRIGAVRLGAEVAITSDTYPEKRYTGEVMFIASEAEFTPKNVQTARERVKLVYAVKVRITGDREHELKPGMPADVRLDLGAP